MVSLRPFIARFRLKFYSSLMALTVLVGCHSAALLEERHDRAKSPRANVIPPTHERDRFSVYGIDAGSPATFALLHFANTREDTEQDFEKATALLHAGKDGALGTEDDRPFWSLHDLHSRLSPSQTTLTHLESAALAEWPVHQDTSAGVVAEEHVFPKAVAARAVGAFSRCSVESLSTRHRLRSKAQRALSRKRPETLAELADLPFVGRKKLVQMVYLEWFNPTCTTTGPMASFHVLPHLFAPQTMLHLNRRFAHFEGTARQFEIETLLNHFTKAESTPYTASDDSRQELAWSASEWFWFTLTTQHQNHFSRARLRHILETRLSAVGQEMKRLADGAWEVWVEDHRVVYSGRMLGIYGEVVFERTSGRAVETVIEFD